MTPDRSSSLAPRGSLSQAAQHRKCDIQHRDYCCKENGYEIFTGSRRSRLRLTDLGEVTDCAEYVAVSYCWKSGAATVSADGDKYFDITISLGVRTNRAPYSIMERAIAYAAYRELPFIWIDQECIEQNDEVEKQSIVEHMDCIFHRARQVVALTTTVVPSARLWFVIHALRRDDLEDAVDPPAVQCLAELLAKDDWFDRASTLQEILVSTRMIDFLLPVASHVPGLVMRLSVSEDWRV